MASVLIDLPDLPEGKEYTGEYRQAKEGEQFLDVAASNYLGVETCLVVRTQEPYFIVADLYERPNWLKPGWIKRESENIYCWTAEHPHPDLQRHRLDTRFLTDPDRDLPRIKIGEVVKV